ncbi:MAG: xanthine dehydrogenase family protein molybdopterin-binding subunit [Deltaproteobacteria bacterium]|nr:xanthine dehydrogenase family protein molybdopterin-binding subunit [Deltaproteobacteria bacterium]
MTSTSEIFPIGKAAPRADARAKVTGTEKYAADYYAADQLWAGIKRAGMAHARLLEINLDKARELAGVVAVLTHKDVQGSNRQGVARKDQPVLVDDKIRHAGDAIALVVAENRALLKKALELITFTCEPLPEIFTMAAALAEGAPLLHADHPDGNILLQGRLETGQGAAALKECAIVIESSFALARQEHAYLETECGFAIYQDHKLEIAASTQTPFRDRAEIAEALGLEVENVRVIAPYCGGAFGGKDGITVQTLLGLAALNAPGRAIKMWWEREESFNFGAKRHRAELHYQLGCDRDGTFKALSVEVDFDTGPYDHLGGVVLALGLEHAGGPYRIPHTQIQGRAIYTNNPIGGAFRGFGVPQVAAAMEQMVDMAAVRTGLSPLAIRLKNGVKRGDRNPLGVTLQTSTGLLDCLRQIEQDPLRHEAEKWKAQAPPGKLRGVGIAAVMHGMGYGPTVPDTAHAKLALSREGRFKIYCGVVDMGQGNATTYQQIAGDLLNQDFAHLELILPDTDQTLPSGSSSASRTTYTFGNALIGACEILKKRVCERAADSLMVEDWQEFTLLPGRLRHLPTGREIPLQRLAALLSPDERVVSNRYRAPVNRDQPTANPGLKLHGIPHLIFSYGVHLAAVEIDKLSGNVAVKKYLAVTDCGNLINPQLFEQQMQGGIAQGIGYSLYEDLKVTKGVVQTSNFATYIIPSALDLPEMICKALAQPESSGPFGLKGVGEIAIDAPLPTIANAVSDACGVRCREFPLTAERLLRALKKEEDNAHKI